MNSSDRVVRYHRRLRPIALPQQESAQTSAFSKYAQPDRTIAGREVPAARLPVIFSASTVMRAGRDGRHQSEPCGRDLPGHFKVAAFAAGFAAIGRSLRRARCLRRDSAPASPLYPSGRLHWNQRFMVRFPDCQTPDF